MDTTEMGEDEVDYSDFVHEQITFLTNNNSTTDALELKSEIEPLAQQGGLRPNQVAEVVAVRAEYASNSESSGSDSAEFRGTFGVDLEEEDDLTDLNGKTEGTTTVIDDSGNQGISGIGSQTAPEVVSSFNIRGSNTVREEIYYRDDAFTGRGPVLDADDSWTFFGALIPNDAGAVDAQVTVMLVYDIYEVDDARSEFALPHGDD